MSYEYVLLDQHVNSNVTETHTFQNRKRITKKQNTKNESNTSWNVRGANKNEIYFAYLILNCCNWLQKVLKSTAFKFCSTLFQTEAPLYEIDFLPELHETQWIK